MFRDRVDAGQQLAVALAAYAHAPDALVLGVPRGGVIVAAEVARELGLPLDVIVVRKIGAPGNPEFAVGAVDEGGNIVDSGGTWASESYLRAEAEVGRAEIARRLAAYRSGRRPLELAGKTAVLVDDGIATGMTLRAAVASLRHRGAGRVIVAAPVAAPGAIGALTEAVDELIVLSAPDGFYAVGQFYRVFDQTEDAEVISALASSR
jgi:putative phosphoribosyl transferase